MELNLLINDVTMVMRSGVVEI
uniref:Uncharacterized protein n=1 Tax=Lepeophtheirus salmonis TaxID=72036 RepID=A0A0K2TG88_LEPSM